MIKLARIISFNISIIGLLLATVRNVHAQFATSSAVSTGKGGGESTASSLPNAGSTELTYIIFVAGAVLFVFGMLKLVLSYREFK